jgi:hypothetical protein
VKEHALKTLISRALALVVLGAAAMQAAGATSYTLITEPSQGLTAVYNLVNSAQHTIDMTMYELTDTRVVISGRRRSI